MRRPRFLTRWLTNWGGLLYYGGWIVLVLAGEFLLQNLVAWWLLLILYFVASLMWTAAVWSLPTPFTTTEAPQ